jgi:hypothetical protein
MPTAIATDIQIQPWPVGKLVLHNEFRTLMEEEDRIVQQRGPRDLCYAYFIYRKSGEFDGWIMSPTTESLQARFELLATRAAITLGTPKGILPLTHFLHCLFLDLRANNSDRLQIYERGGFIDRLFEGAAIYCDRLDRRSLEEARTKSEVGLPALLQVSSDQWATSLRNEEQAALLSDEGRSAAVGEYTIRWACSEAGLARAAAVDPGDLSKWKKGQLPAGSEKRARIERALLNNQEPLPPPKRLQSDW